MKGLDLAGIFTGLLTVARKFSLLICEIIVYVTEGERIYYIGCCIGISLHLM